MPAATPTTAPPPSPTSPPGLPSDGGISVEAGRFYPQAGGGTGRGFAISDLPLRDSADTVTFLTAFQGFGGVLVTGFPASRRYLGDDGFLYQATQAALLQWRPELGTAVLADTFELLSQSGADDELLLRGIPQPMGDGAQTFEEAKAIRFGWLTDDAIKAKYTAVGGLEAAMQIYGLPMSLPEKHGPFVAQRFQRVTFQHWVEEVPGAPSQGSVTAVLGGDLLKEFGLLPLKAVQPHSLDERRTVTERPVGARDEASPTPTPAPGTTATPTPTLEPGVTPSPTPTPGATPRVTAPRSELRVQIGSKRFTIHGAIDEVGDQHLVIGGYSIQIDHRLVRRLKIKGSVDVGMFGKVEGSFLADGTLAAEEVKAEAPKPEKVNGEDDDEDGDKDEKKDGDD